MGLVRVLGEVAGSLDWALLTLDSDPLNIAVLSPEEQDPELGWQINGLVADGSVSSG